MKADLVRWLHLESDAGDIDLIPKPPGTTFEALDDDHFEFDMPRRENGTDRGFDAEFFVASGDEDGNRKTQPPAPSRT